MVVLQGLNSAYDLCKGEEYPPPNWPPGTYQVAGIVKNLGVTYDESNFDVNTQIKAPNGTIFYDNTVTVTDVLAPGATTFVTFPDFTIPDVAAWEGKYTLTMKTMLAGDDHPNNDKKQFTYCIVIEPHIPPYTWADLYGTMGKNGWFISNVTVVLYAIDYKFWPSGVNHTYYKIDNGDWNEYFYPFNVSDDGHRVVYFYSVDKDIPPNVEETKEIDFDIDQTVPSISMSTEKVGFKQWKFIATVSDETSGPCLVQCYIDDMWLGNITAPGPYEWSWTGKGNHTVTGIVYDNAGNSAENDVVFSYSLNEYQHQRFLLLSMLGKIIQRILSHFPMLSEFTELFKTSADTLS